MVPTKFAEHYLVHELSVSKWGAYRTLPVETTVDTHRDAAHDHEPGIPESRDDQNPQSLKLEN